MIENNLILKWMKFDDLKSCQISSVIYIVQCVIDDKMYVGKTSGDFTTRINGHVYDAFHRKNKRNIKPVFHSSLLKHGLNKFQFMVLECLPADELNKREEFYVRLLNTHVSKGCGYNMTWGGEGFKGWSMPQYAKDALKKQIVQYDLKTGEIIETFNSFTEAVKKTNISNITYACRGRIPHAGGFGWKYKNQDDAKRGSWSTEAKKQASYRKRILRTLEKSVAQLDPESNQAIAIYPSIKVAFKETGITNISMVCRGARSIAGGYRWKYVERVDVVKQNENVASFSSMTRSANSCVESYDLKTGKTIFTYNSIKEAEMSGYSHISDVCRGARKSAGGLGWRYAQT